MTLSPTPNAILVLPHLRVQNANAISSPLTHGFPAITQFVGLMWALERKLVQAGVPLHLHGVGVICHHHQEQVAQGYVRTFNLTRNPVSKDGSTAAIVEEGRIHLDVTLIFSVSERRIAGSIPMLVSDGTDAMQAWAQKTGEVLASMRVAGGSVLPTRPVRRRRVRPWMAVLSEKSQEQDQQFRQWRRQWLPGFALVGRDDLLTNRLTEMRKRQLDVTLLDAWLHAARFNHEPLPPKADKKTPTNDKVRWGDPLRGAGSGWTVPIPVGYASLSERHAAGTVRNARDASTPLRFVESIYSFGEWVGPHRLAHLDQLLWHAEFDEAQGVYRCRNNYNPEPTQTEIPVANDDWDADDSYD
ncbi:MAG: type I-F CRISPR-associated protein Csy2 [Pseudomonadota bacterium]|nr:type I-F CRISPR-associated protein Csy2 [Pseudomonadota bacterium]